jgi:hypothetical protein
MALGITAAVVNNSGTGNETVAHNATSSLANATAIDGSALIALGVEVLLTFHASATLGATASVYSSADGTNFTTASVQDFDIPVTAGGTVRYAFTALPGHKAYKVTVANLDAAQSITALYIRAEPQVLS